MQFHYKNLSAPNNSTLLLLRSFEPSSTPLGLFMMSPSAFRRLSLLPPFRSPTPSSAPASASEDEERHFSDDASSHHSTQLVINVEPPMPSFQVKRVDLYYSNWSKSWKYRVSVNVIIRYVSLNMRSRVEHEQQGCCRTPSIYAYVRHVKSSDE